MAGKPIKIAILANGKQARSEIGSTESALQRMGKMGKRIGAGIAVGGAVAGAALVKLSIDSVKAASDSEQSIGATESIFKQYADTVIERSKKANQAVGLSANEYRELNNQLGAMLKNTGKPLGEVAGLTDKLTKRAADMSAMFGGTTREAVEALSSALRGETDPIEKYGVSIKDSNLEAYLAAKGLGKLEGAAKDQAKAQARVALIFDQTKDAAGQFGRESDTLAGKQQRLAAKAEDLKAKFGKILTPALLKGADAVDKHVLPAVEDGINKFAEWWPSIQKTSKQVGSDLVPVLRGGAEVIGALVGVLKEIPTPLLKLAAGAGAAAYVFPKLSGAMAATGGGISSFATYAGVLNAELRDTDARGKLAATATQKLGGMAKQAAGMGGLMALTGGLTSAATEGTSFGNVLSSAAGGAGIGAMFGPIGALVGAGAGGGLAALAGAFTGATKEASRTRLELLKAEGFKDAKSDADDLAEALSGVVNAYGKVPRAAVTAGFAGKDGKLEADVKALREMGVSMDTITSAAMGEAEALKIVQRNLQDNAAARKVALDMAKTAANEAIAKDASAGAGDGRSKANPETKKLVEARDAAAKAYEAAAAAEARFGDRISQNTGKIAAHKAEVAGLASQLGVTVKQYNSWPAAVRTKIENEGLPQTSADTLRLISQYKGLQGFGRIQSVVSASGAEFTRKQIVGLGRQYNLTPKQVSTLMTLSGAEKVKAKAKETAAAVKGATGKPAPVKLDVDASRAKAKAGQAAAMIAGYIKTPKPAKLDADAKPAQRAVATGKAALKSYGNTKIKGPNFFGPTWSALQPVGGAVRSGGTSIGLNFSAGTASGISSGSGAVASAARSMVQGALQAARVAAEIRSPSRKAKKDGRFIAQGYKAGIDGGKKGVAKSAQGLMTATLKESTSGAKEIVSSVDSWLSKLGQGASGKKAKARLAKQRKQLLKATADETAKLAANGKQRNAVAEQLTVAKDKLNEAKQAFADYKTAVADSVRSSASLAKVGEGVGFGSIEQLIAKRKALAAQAGEWKNVIARLTASGLNKTDLDELIQMGPEAGMGTAQAILGGGKSAVTQLNTVQSQLNATANAMGQSTAKTMKQAGIDSAAGLVNGLAAKSKQLDAAAKSLAKTLVKAIKKELGIKSPSRVFKALGKYTTDGLVIGLDDVRVAKAGKALASDLQSGFGAPALRAVDGTVGSRFASAAQQPVQVIVQVPPTANLAAVGREIQRAIDAHMATGGRVRAA